MSSYVIHKACTDSADPGEERFKLAFTMRDSPSDYINVTCWGSETYIRSLVDSFKICDVGEWRSFCLSITRLSE